jgi:hypothetical protein
MANGKEDIGVLDTIRELRSREPFVPFGITMTSGDDFTIADSELLAIGRSQVICCLPRTDHVACLGISQIVTVQEVAGKSRRRAK